jgi:Fe-S cluster assembly ATP-binding protein
MQPPPDMSGIKLRDLLKVASKGKTNPETLAENLDMKRFLDPDELRCEIENTIT